MYTLNTQLAYFKYDLNFKRLIVNIKWFKLEKISDLHIQAAAFNARELDHFCDFIERNKINFPNNQFIEVSPRENFGIAEPYQRSAACFPLYFILAKTSALSIQGNINRAVFILLTDENYQTPVDYNLEFDIIGRVEIYKEVMKN